MVPGIGQEVHDERNSPARLEQMTIHDVAGMAIVAATMDAGCYPEVFRRPGAGDA